MDNLGNSPMIFTLTEQKTNDDVSENWAQDLQRLREQRVQNVEETTSNHIVTSITQNQTVSVQRVEKQFGDAELDEAYRQYLRECETQHNQNQAIDEDDVGILIQEDWLQAQSALQFERRRQELKPEKTLIFNCEKANLSVSEHTERLPENRLPEFAVHVYGLPDLPATRRVKILSEQELINGLRDKLTPHLTNAVAGMVRQVLQKKLAMLSYELQIQFNEETPQVVQEVLAHNLDAVLRTVKHQLREK